MSRVHERVDYLVYVEAMMEANSAERGNVFDADAVRSKKWSLKKTLLKEWRKLHLIKCAAKNHNLSPYFKINDTFRISGLKAIFLK